MIYNLGFGNSVAVRKAFLNTYRGNFIVFTHDTLEEFDYPPYIGNEELIETTRQVIKRQTGQEYKHIILTTGATGAINIALNVYREMGHKYCLTREAPYYLRYPTMIGSAGLLHIEDTERYQMGNHVILLDIPSNPLNIISHINERAIAPVICDGVYLNNVYTNGNIKPPNHDIYVGSYSKLLGLNGLRVGYLGVNDDYLFEKLKVGAQSSYCGMSVAEAQLANQLLYDFDWNAFEIKSRFALDTNREEFSKLEKFFGNVPVSYMGMFYYGPLDGKAKELLEKSGIMWTSGSSLGTDDSFGRFNLGQDRQVIRDAVREVLKNDRI